MEASGLNPTRRDRIPVPVWNRVVRAADFAEQFAHSADGEAAFADKAGNLILAKNVTGAALDRYSIVRFSGVQTNPALSTAARASFLSRPILTADKPDGGDVAWGVAVDPMKADACGRIAIAGVVPVRVSVTSASHRYAKPQQYGTSQLVSGDSAEGAATILWKEAGTGSKWALVKLSGGGGGGTTIRVGKFSGPWGNDPGLYGASNIKPVTLYVMDDNPSHPNDLHPELDGNGDPVIAVTINLFSYIPTPPSSGQMMWCAIVPFASVSGEYQTGDYEPGLDYPTPVMKAYDSLWLLVAAEC